MSKHYHADKIIIGARSLACAYLPTTQRCQLPLFMFSNGATWIAFYDDNMFGGLGWTPHDRTAQERPLRSKRQALAVAARWVRETIRRKSGEGVGGNVRHLGSRLERKQRKESAEHQAKMKAWCKERSLADVIDYDYDYDYEVKP